MKKYSKSYLRVVLLTVVLVGALAGSAVSADFSPFHGHTSINVSISGIFNSKQEILLAPSGFEIAGFGESNVTSVGSGSASATISADKRRLTINVFSGVLFVTPPGCKFVIPNPFGGPSFCVPFDPVAEPGSYSGTFTIFEDTTPPTLTLPPNTVIETTSSAGEVHNFSATATDNVDPSPTVVCTPPSGSTVPLGVTTVDCTATDALGNSTNGSFNVTVSLPQGASDALAVAGIDPANVPPDVLDALIAADQQGLLEVIPSGTTADQNLVLQSNAVIVLVDRNL